MSGLSRLSNLGKPKKRLYILLGKFVDMCLFTVYAPSTILFLFCLSAMLLNREDDPFHIFQLGIIDLGTRRLIIHTDFIIIFKTIWGTAAQVNMEDAFYYALKNVSIQTTQLASVLINASEAIGIKNGAAAANMQRDCCFSIFFPPALNRKIQRQGINWYYTHKGTGIFF